MGLTQEKSDPAAQRSGRISSSHDSFELRVPPEAAVDHLYELFRGRFDSARGVTVETFRLKRVSTHAEAWKILEKSLIPHLKNDGRGTLVINGRIHEIHLNFYLAEEEMLFVLYFKQRHKKRL